MICLFIVNILRAQQIDILLKGGHVRDEDIVQVLTYIRQHFNNNENVITTKDVSNVRKASAKK